MKILVTAQAEKIAVVVVDLGPDPVSAGWRGLRHQAGAGAMLEAAVAVADDHHLELVVIHRRRFAEKADMVFANSFQIGCKTRSDHIRSGQSE